MCGNLPAVLGPLHPSTIKPFLPYFLSRRHSREKRYQALSRFTVLIATESWAGPGNEATVVLQVPYHLARSQAQRGGGGGGERAWFQPFTRVLTYLGFNHVLISGRVPMRPSKSHGQLHDVAIHHIKPV